MEKEKIWITVLTQFKYADQKIWGKQAENGALWTKSDIKVTQSLYRIQKSHTLQICYTVGYFDIYVQKTLKDTWALNVMSVLIKVKPYIT